MVLPFYSVDVYSKEVSSIRSGNVISTCILQSSAPSIRLISSSAICYIFSTIVYRSYLLALSDIHHNKKLQKNSTKIMMMLIIMDVVYVDDTMIMTSLLLVRYYYHYYYIYLISEVVQHYHVLFHLNQCQYFYFISLFLLILLFQKNNF